MDNFQAVGYLLLACKKQGMTKEQAEKLKNSMFYMFDMKTEEEAEEQGYKWLNEED